MIKINQKSVVINGLPSDKKIKIKVLLDGKQTEILHIDLAKVKNHVVTLELAYGYANWRQAHNNSM